jgi:hypothetical protein
MKLKKAQSVYIKNYRGIYTTVNVLVLKKYNE